MPSVARVILLVIDDLRADQFYDLISEGKLPNIQTYLMDGIKSECTACYPGITIPAQPTMLTGVYPNAYIPPGGHWVKRESHTIRNYNTLDEYPLLNKELGPTKTIFELIPGTSAGLMLGLYRGCNQYYPTKWQIIRLYLWHVLLHRRDLIHMNTLLMNRLLDYYNKPRKYFKTADPPQLSVAWVLSTDSMLHNHGANSEFYLHSLVDLDKNIGYLINGKGRRKGLKALGLYHDTAFIVTSDHGNYQAKKSMDIAPFFNKIGLQPLIPGKQEGNFDATLGSVGFFNLRGATWREHPSIDQMRHYGPKRIDLFKALFQIPGTKYLYYRDDDNTFDKGIIHVLRKEGATQQTAMIEYNEDQTRIIGDDIYDYSLDEQASKLLDGKFHSIDEWLSHTHHLDFPMLIDQIPRLFRNPNFCDIMISSVGETCFNYEHGLTKNAHIHGHDIGLHNAITVPLLISGPNISPTQLSYSKSTDILPTILTLLGLPIPPHLVGTSLV
ncbi:MAG: alkaline phosphatase family protein [Candidatus Helarchaeota archaeon]